MKRILIMAGVILASCAAMADTQIVDGIEWTYTVSDGKVSVGGANPATGDITIPATLGDYSVTSIGYRAFKGRSELTSVTIPAGVTSINDYAFEDCSGLMSFDVNEGNLKYKSENGLLLMKDGTTLIAGVNGDVTIPEGVTSIGYFAFKGRSGLTSVTMPTSVTAIGLDAFYNCSGLTSVTIPEGVMSIGDDAFYNCSGLASVEISSSVTIIGNSAFEGCSKLTSVTIPSSVTRIDSEAFSYCYSLTNVAFSGNAPNCGALTFFLVKSGCTATVYEGTTGWDDDGDGKWQGLTLLWRKAPKPDGGPYTETVDGVEWTFVVTNGEASVGGGSASATAVPESTSGAITIPSVLGGCSVTRIGDYAFSYCRGLTNVMIPSSVTSIGVSAFNDCDGLTNMVIPPCVTKIEMEAFCGCRRLASATIPSNVTYIAYQTFRNCSGLTSMTIPSSVTCIGREAFYACEGLTSITIPSSVTNISDYAFSYCSQLLNITIPPSVTMIGNYTFSYCSKLTHVTIPSGVTRIGNCTFHNCSGLTSVMIPSSVTNIGESAFSCCDSMTEVTIPSSVVNVANWAFYDCNTLTNVLFLGNAPSCGNRVFGNVASGCAATVYEGTTGWDDDGDGKWQGLTVMWRKAPKPDGGPYTETVDGVEWTFVVTNGEASVGQNPGRAISQAIKGAVAIPPLLGGCTVTKIGDQAFYYCSNVTNVTIPMSVVSIGNYAFAGCVSMPCLEMPDGVGSIGKEAFSNCGLVTMTIPTGVTNLENGVFYYCQQLTSVEIPEGVTCIGNSAFQKCNNLTSVTIPSSVQYVGIQAFDDCSSLTNVAIKKGVTFIGSCAFEDCHDLTRVVIPASVTALGSSVFYGCYGLTHVVIAESVSSVGEGMFASCGALLSIDFEGAPPKGVSNAYIKTDASIRYNVAYEAQWLPIVTSCGWTNAEPYTPMIEPSGEIVVPEGEAEEKAAEINNNPTVKAQYLKAPGGVETTSDYLGCFSAIATSGSTVEFVLNEEGTNQIKNATATVKTAALDVVFSDESTLTVSQPLVGFYYSLRQGKDVSVGDKADLNKIGGRDTISFELTKEPNQYFYQSLITPVPVQEE